MKPALNLPLFTAGRLQANLESKIRDYNALVYEYNDLVLQSAKAVADRLNTLRSKDEELSIQSKILAKTDAIFDRDLLRFEHGIDNYFIVLEAQEEVYNQRLNQISFQHQKLLVALQLIKALGGGYNVISPISIPDNENILKTE